jgi:outer membrane protein
MRMKRSCILIAAVIAATAGISRAQESQGGAFTLQEAIAYAMKNSPSMVNANNDIIAAKYRKREIAGIGYPQLNASFDIKDFFKIPVSVIPNFVAPAVYSGIMSATQPTRDLSTDPQATVDFYEPIAAQFGQKYQANASASVSQIIFSSDYMVALQAAKYLHEMSTLNANRNTADVVASVSKAYYSVLVSRERMTLLDANLARLKKLLDDTRAINEQGLVEQIDVERIEVTYNNLLTEKDKVTRLLQLGEAVLRFQMGYDAASPLTLTETLPADIQESEISAAGADPMNRPEYRLLKSTEELGVLALKRQKYGYMPSLVAYGSGGYTAYRQQFDIFKTGGEWYPSLVLGGTLSLNIFDGLQRHNRIQQAKLDLTKNQQNVKQLQMAIQLETSTALANYQNALLSMKAQSRNKDLARHVQEVAQKKYESGVGSNLEVVTAETSLKEAETNYFQAVYELLVAKTDYKKAIGALAK